MITPEELIPYRTSSDDYSLTEELKSQFARLRRERQPFYLTEAEFDQILHWKLRSQYGRQQARRQANTGNIIRAITGLALTISHPDPDYELELRIGALCTLRGVGVPVASAILALVYPETYAVIDFRGWRQVFGERKSTFTISDYKRYLQQLQDIAAALKWPVQEVDLAIWEYDRMQGGANTSEGL